MKDRKRLLALPLFSQTESDRNATSIVQAQAPVALKPKPILVDKQSSEPSSPVTKHFKEPPVVSVTRRPMHRGFSDLGNRIKKRVTLRYIDSFKLRDSSYSFNFSSISSHYTCPSETSSYEGEVVIVVPALDPPQQQPSSAQVASTHIEMQSQERDMGSPRTTTESSGINASP